MHGQANRKSDRKQAARPSNGGDRQKTFVAWLWFLHESFTYSVPWTTSDALRAALVRRGQWYEKSKFVVVDDGEKLMERLQKHDASAFESLYDRYHRLVFGIALRMLGETTLAEDLTQAVFMKLWTKPDSFQSGNFSAWLSRVTRNRALDLLRSRSSRAEDEIPMDLPDDGSLDEVIFARLDSQRVRAALALLPDEQRMPIELGFFGGITHEEIARKTDIPLGTIKTRIRSGLRRLRGELAGSVTR